MISRDAPIVYCKSVPGEVQEMGSYLTASLFSMVRAVNQTNGRNSDEESI